MTLTKMNISQALRRQKKLKGDLKELLSRAAVSVTYDEKQPPAFSFATSLEQADATREELIHIESALRVTNARTKIEWESRSITLSEAVTRLQEMKSRISWLKEILSVEAQTMTEKTSVEWDDLGEKRAKVQKKIKCDLPETKRVELIEKEQTAFDALNDAVETINHQTQLLAI
mgnify:FL=1